jgi:RHS repeat-associated protein
VDSVDESNQPQTQSSVLPPITLFTSSIGNPYFFTGRRLHFLETLHDSPDPEEPEANWQIQYNRARHYDPHHGRWLQRDPVRYEDGMNMYQYVGSSPVLFTDPLGQWTTDVHRDKTAEWAQDLGYPPDAAYAIGEATDAVDGGETGPYPWPLSGDQSYHFDRPPGGSDSRMDHRWHHRIEAKSACNWGEKNDDPDVAVTQLGLALHPLQDWVAHGDHFKHNTGQIYDPLRHNGRSLQNNLRRQYGHPMHYPDDPRLDALGSPDGRPAGIAIITVRRPYGVDFDYAQYHPGNRRIRLTEDVTRDLLLKNFRQYVKDFAKPCGKCRKYFGVKLE